MASVIGMSVGTTYQEREETPITSAIREITDNGIGKSAELSDGAHSIGINSRLIDVKGTRVFVGMTQTPWAEGDWNTQLSIVGPKKQGVQSTVSSVHGKGLFNSMAGLVDESAEHHLLAIRVVHNRREPSGHQIYIQRVGSHADAILMEEPNQEGCVRGYISGKLHIFHDPRLQKAHPYMAAFDHKNAYNARTDADADVVSDFVSFTRKLLLQKTPWAPADPHTHPMDQCDDFLKFVDDQLGKMGVLTKSPNENTGDSILRAQKTDTTIYAIWPASQQVQMAEYQPSPNAPAITAMRVNDTFPHVDFANHYLPAKSPSRAVIKALGIKQGDPSRTRTSFGDHTVDWDAHWIEKMLLAGELVPFTDKTAAAGLNRLVEVHDAGFVIESYCVPSHLLTAKEPAIVAPHLMGSLAVGFQPEVDKGQLFVNAPALAKFEGKLMEFANKQNDESLNQGQSIDLLLQTLPPGYHLTEADIKKLEEAITALGSLKKDVEKNKGNWVKNLGEAKNKLAAFKVQYPNATPAELADEYLHNLCEDGGTKLIWDCLKRVKYGLTGPGNVHLVTFTKEVAVNKAKTRLMGDNELTHAMWGAVMRRNITIFHARVQRLSDELKVSIAQALADAEARKAEKARLEREKAEQDAADRAQGEANRLALEKKERAKKAQAAKVQRMREKGVLPTIKSHKVQFLKGTDEWLTMRPLDEVEAALQEGRLRLPPNSDDAPTLFTFKSTAAAPAANGKLFVDGKVGTEIVAATDQADTGNDYFITRKAPSKPRYGPAPVVALCDKQMTLNLPNGGAQFTFHYQTASSGPTAYAPALSDRQNWPRILAFAQAIHMLPQSFQACFGKQGALRCHLPAGSDPISAMLRIQPVIFKPKSSKPFPQPVKQESEGVMLLTIYMDPLRDFFNLPTVLPATEHLPWLAHKIVHEALNLYIVQMDLSKEVAEVLRGNILLNRGQTTAAGSSKSSRKRPAQSASAPANPPPPPPQRARTDGGGGASSSSSSAGLHRTPAGTIVEEMD